MQNIMMVAPLDRTLSRLRNTRDLRAEVASLAADLVDTDVHGNLNIIDPAIRSTKVREEWKRLLRAIDPDIRSRMRLDITHRETPPRRYSNLYNPNDAIAVDRPNYRYEVFRLLLGASLARSEPNSIKGLVNRIGASQTPIREAILALKRAGIAHSSGRGLHVTPEDISQDLLAKVGALPQTVRFRFERGARIKPPKVLMERALPLLAQSEVGNQWGQLALSGAAAAHADVPQLDLMGLPRLDLVAQVPREAKHLDANLFRQLDDGLELEPSVLAPAPVVVTLIRANTPFFPVTSLGHSRCAFPADIFLSLLDMGLRNQALQYAREVHR